MKREIIIPDNEQHWLSLRTKDLTSSDIATIFGCGYLSYDELIHHKRNGTSSIIEQSERLSWGRAFESAIAEEFARQNGWTIRHKKEYIRLPEYRIGSSFDYEIIDSNENRDTNGLVEVKNVDRFQYKKEWKQGFEIEAPLKIELQLQNELLVSGLTYGYIAACVGGNQGICLKREANKKVHQAILEKCKIFWKDIRI